MACYIGASRRHADDLDRAFDVGCCERQIEDLADGRLHSGSDVIGLAGLACADERRDRRRHVAHVYEISSRLEISDFDARPRSSGGDRGSLARKSADDVPFVLTGPDKVKEPSPKHRYAG